MERRLGGADQPKEEGRVTTGPAEGLDHRGTTRIREPAGTAFRSPHGAGIRKQQRSRRATKDMVGPEGFEPPTKGL